MNDCTNERPTARLQDAEAEEAKDKREKIIKGKAPKIKQFVMFNEVIKAIAKVRLELDLPESKPPKKQKLKLYMDEWLACCCP